ncbi:putative zinc-binding protein [Chloroflexota bacterium]
MSMGKDENQEKSKPLDRYRRHYSAIILPCSGGSNGGQIANAVSLRLDDEGTGRMYCLASIAANLEVMISAARRAERIVVIDGCQMACARKITEHAGLKVTDWICVAQENIPKAHNLKLVPEEIEAITIRTKELMSRVTGA